MQSRPIKQNMIFILMSILCLLAVPQIYAKAEAEANITSISFNDDLKPASANTRTLIATPPGGNVFQTLTSDVVNFQWTALSYVRLQVGTAEGRSDLYMNDFGKNQHEVTISGIPTDGAFYYATLIVDHYSTFPVVYKTSFRAYTAGAPIHPAKMISPLGGSILDSTTATFEWEYVEGAHYDLRIGTKKGKANLYKKAQGENTTVTVPGLPSNGSTIYVELSTYTNNNWLSKNYTYQTYKEPIASKIISPEPYFDSLFNPDLATTLPSTTVKFEWSDGGAYQYRFDIAYDSSFKNIMYSKNQGTNTSVTVSGLPSHGGEIYVRLWSLLDNNIWRSEIYVYKTIRGSGTPNIGIMTSPVNGSTLTSSTAIFRWSNEGASEYQLFLGDLRGYANLYRRSHGTNTAVTISGLPNDGSKIYARLWSLIDNIWYKKDYVYTSYTAVFSTDPAKMISPTNGSKLTSTTATFRWDDIGAYYWLFIGNQHGGYNFYDKGHSNTSATVSGLPTNGGPIFVRLWSYIDGVWVYNDYAYRATK